MLWLIFILLFPAWLFAAQVEPVTEPIDGDGRDVQLPVGTTEVKPQTIAPGDNTALVTFDRSTVDPTQTIDVEIWSLISNVWVKVCAIGGTHKQAVAVPGFVQCDLRGGTESKAVFVTGKAPLDTKVTLDTLAVNKPQEIQPLHHSVAYDNSDAVVGNSGTTFTIASLAVAVTDPLILCAPAETDTLVSVSGVTFNSVAMTQIGTPQVQDDRSLSLFRLTAQSGTHDAVVTWDSSIGDVAGMGCQSFTGVDQASPVGGREESISFDGAPITITVPTDGLAVDFVAAVNAASGCIGITTQSGATGRFLDCTGSAGDAAEIGGSTRDTTGTFLWDSTPGAYNFQLGVPINAAVAVAAAPATRRRFAQ